MKQPRKHLLCLLLALLLTGVLLAGCAADTADANADLPVITVGCDNYPPFTYVNSDGKPVGIDVELAGEAFPPHGLPPRICHDQLGRKKTRCLKTASSTASGAAFQ